MFVSGGNMFLGIDVRFVGEICFWGLMFFYWGVFGDLLFFKI
jgi:hypothetical protein